MMLYNCQIHVICRVAFLFYLFFKGNEYFSRKTLGDVLQKYLSQMVRNTNTVDKFSIVWQKLWYERPGGAKEKDLWNEGGEGRCSISQTWLTPFLQNDWMYSSPQKCERKWWCERTGEGHVKWGGRRQVHCSINLKTVRNIWPTGSGVEFVRDFTQAHVHETKKILSKNVHSWRFFWYFHL